MVKYLNSDRSFKLKDNPLHVILPSGSGKSFVNKIWASYGKSTNIVKSTTWVMGVGTVGNNRYVNIQFKLDQFSTTVEVEWDSHTYKNGV